MSDQPVLFSRVAASCRLTLNREDKCHAINEEMIESLDHYLNEIENDTTLRLVKRRTKNAKAFHDKCENFSFRASNETAVLITAFYSLHGDHLGYG